MSPNAAAAAAPCCPERVVADGGFTNQAAIEGMEELAIEFYGSLPEPEVRQAAAMKAAGIDPAFAPPAFRFQAGSNSPECPAGKQLGYVRHSSKTRVAREVRPTINTRHRHRLRIAVLCEHQKKCCPRPGQGRLVSIRQTGNAAVVAFRGKMDTDAAREIYKQRGPVAECPNAWLKEKFGIRKFRMRGWAKASLPRQNAIVWIVREKPGHRGAEGLPLFHALQNEVHPMPVRTLHAALGRADVILLAHLRLRPFNRNTVVPGLRLNPPLILVGPAREHRLVDHRLTGYVTEKMHHLPRTSALTRNDPPLLI